MHKLNRLVSLLLAFILFGNVQAEVSGVTKVLLAKTPTGSTALALSMLTQINETFDNTGLGNNVFVSAKTVAGLPDVVDVTNCPSTIAQTFLLCARQQLKSTRNTYDADIVLILTPFLDASATQESCGSVMIGTVNPILIQRFNGIFAYGTVETTCLAVELNGEKIASHEVGHLFQIEHVADPSTNLPVGAEENHAAVANQAATVTAQHLDCAGFECMYEDFYSKDGQTFEGGGSAGDSNYSDAHDIILNQSWDVVSAYRPLPAPPPCDDPVEAQFVASFGYCNGNYANMQITADLFAYEITNARYEQKLGNNPWEIFYEGLLTCPSTQQIGAFLVRVFLETAQGTSSCQMWVNPPPCEPGEPGW